MTSGKFAAWLRSSKSASCTITGQAKAVTAAAVAIITFLFGWGQFIFPLVLSSTNTTQPLTVALSALAGRHVVPYTMINAGAIVAIGVPAVIVFFLNRYIVDGIVAGSVK